MGKIKPMHDTCVSKIPLESGLYMDPTSRIASKHASKIECSNHFPLTILSEDGWVTVSDTIKPAIAPTDMKLLKEKTGHENMKTGGIYRHEALAQFEDILEYGSFHEAIIETLGYGICRKDGPCNAQNTPGSIGISGANGDSRMVRTDSDIWRHGADDANEGQSGGSLGGSLRGFLLSA